MANESIPLRTYRINPRKSRIELSGDVARLVLPGYFGRRTWSVPVGQMGVVDLTSMPVSDTSEEDVYRDAVRIPYFFTTGPATAPTTLLLFEHPQRVPPLRAVAALAPNTSLPFGYFESRSERGAYVDGVLLRAADPAGAAARLVSAGAAPVQDPGTWLREHRERVIDPVERETLLRHRRTSLRLARTSTALHYVTVLGAAALLSRTDIPGIAWALPVVGGGLTYLLRRLARREPRSSGLRTEEG